MAARAAVATTDARTRAEMSLASTPIEAIAIAVLLAVFAWQGLVPAWRVLNTDFPNYYAVARVYLRAHRLSPEVYDWLWLQRHSDVGRVVTYVPHPPQDFFPVLPLAGLSPLAAKRAWLIFNLALLAITVMLLAEISRLKARSVLLVTLLCVIPLRAQFMNAQMYLLVLFFCVVALWLYMRGHDIGAALALAAGVALKLYPALFVILFLRKKQWRAAATLVGGSAASLLIAAAMVGIAPVHRFAVEVLPRAVRGEIINPADLGYSSISALLHRWLVADEVLNPHPAMSSTLLFSFLQPLCAGVMLALAAMTIGTRADEQSAAFDWSVMMVLLLALSPLALSYHYCLLIAPAVLAIAYFLREGRTTFAAATLAAYLLAGLPLPTSHADSAWLAPLHMPRLAGCIALLAIFAYHRRGNLAGKNALRFAALALFVAAQGVAGNLRHFAVSDPWPRVAGLVGAMNVDPAPAAGQFWYTALTDQGYRTLSSRGGTIGLAGADAFHPAVAGDHLWLEVVRQGSRIFVYGNYRGPGRYVTDGGSPSVSPDGRWLAFLRDDGSQAQLLLRSLSEGREFPVNLPGYDVLESAVSNSEVIFAAQRGLETSLFRQTLPPAAPPQRILAGCARYPAISPDGQRLAFSRWSTGAWRLWMSDMRTGKERQLTFADCNSVTPAWSHDGQTLFYASDCERLGLTTLRSIPLGSLR